MYSVIYIIPLVSVAELVPQLLLYHIVEFCRAKLVSVAELVPQLLLYRIYGIIAIRTVLYVQYRYFESLTFVQSDNLLMKWYLPLDFSEKQGKI